MIAWLIDHWPALLIGLLVAIAYLSLRFFDPPSNGNPDGVV